MLIDNKVVQKLLNYESWQDIILSFKHFGNECLLYPVSKNCVRRSRKFAPICFFYYFFFQLLKLPTLDIQVSFIEKENNN